MERKEEAMTMSKYVIECPACGRFAEASTGFLGIGKTRKINCSCGNVINVATDKMVSRECPHCGNMVIYDQSKSNRTCPVCHEKINGEAALHNKVMFSCPSCSCKLSADRNADKYVCPLCETEIDVQAQVMKEKISDNGLASVIKFEGDHDTLIWKHPIEDFNMGSQLIVHESQEAIFFRDGQALDLFGAGRYTLETDQFPIMEKLYKLPSDSDQTFHSEVYFINKAQHMAFKWGTSEKVTLIDPTSQAPIAVGARGLFNFRVSNARKLLLKLVGTTSGMKRGDLFGSDGDQANGYARNYFRAIVQLGVSTKLAQIITEQNIDILQIDQQKMQLSDALKESLLSYFDDYGMKITEFLVEGIILPQPGEMGYDVVQTLIRLRQANLQKSVIATETDIRLTEMEAKKTVDIQGQQNAAEVEKAHQNVVAVKGETSVMEAQWKGQQKITETQADVQAERIRMELEMQKKAQTAQIEAEEMRAKGFNQKDVIQGQVMTAFAENQPQDGGMNMSGMAGQAMQAGVGFATMGAMAGMATNMMGTGVQLGKDMTGAMAGSMTGGADSGNNIGGNSAVTGDSSDTGAAPGGFEINDQRFSALAALGGRVQDTPQENVGWKCPECGQEGITSKFCPECGVKRPEPVQVEIWKCPDCGTEGISSKFCPECGAKKPEPVQVETWKCPNCGTEGITSKFCPECGSRRSEEVGE